MACSLYGATISYTNADLLTNFCGIRIKAQTATFKKKYQ